MKLPVLASTEDVGNAASQLYPTQRQGMPCLYEKSVRASLCISVMTEQLLDLGKNPCRHADWYKIMMGYAVLKSDVETRHALSLQRLR